MDEELGDEQWKLIAPLLPQYQRRGRPRYIRSARVAGKWSAVTGAWTTGGDWLPDMTGTPNPISLFLPLPASWSPLQGFPSREFWDRFMY